MISSLALLPRPGPKLTVLAGQTLFNLDEKAEIAYLVVDGILLVSLFSQQGREVITSVFFPGELCGGFAVLTDSNYSGTARSPNRSPVAVHPILRSELVELVRQSPAFYNKLIATQQEKERYKDRLVLGMISETCEQRVASSLLWLGRKTAESTRPGQRFQLCRQELADLVGTTIETVIRVVSSFRKRGLVRESEGYVEIDSAALAALTTSVANRRARSQRSSDLEKAL